MPTESISLHPSLAVEVRDLRVNFGDVAVLRGVNLRVPQGQIVALIGPNGSGKTTLLRCLLGLQKFSEGEVKIFGESDLDKALPRVGYVPQRLSLERSFILSVREFLALRLRQTQALVFQVTPAARRIDQARRSFRSAWRTFWIGPSRNFPADNCSACSSLSRC